MKIRRQKTGRRSAAGFGNEVREAVGMLSDINTRREGRRRIAGFADLNDGLRLLIGHLHNAAARPHLLEVFARPEHARVTFDAIMNIIGGRLKTSRKQQELAAELAVEMLKREELREHRTTIEAQINDPSINNRVKAVYRGIIAASKPETDSTA